MIVAPAMFYKILLTMWAYFTGAASPWAILLYGIVSSVFTSALGLIVFELFKWLDNITGRYFTDALEEVERAS